MNTQLLVSFFGPSWRTSVFGIISRFAFVCGMLSQYPEHLSFLPDNVRMKVLGVCGLVWFVFGLLKDFVAADHPASSSSVSAVAASVTKIVSLLVVCLALSALVGCATLARWQANPRIQAVEHVALRLGWNIGVQAATTLASGGEINRAWAVPVALNSVSDLVKETVDNQQAAALISATADQFSADPQLHHVGQDLGKAFLAANPSTPEERQAVVVALATGASNGLATSAETVSEGQP